MNEIRTGFLVGNAAAQNVLLGFVPDMVEVFNLTDRDKIHVWFRGNHMVFTSGGTTEIEAGNTIIGATSGARAKVRRVMLTSGSWAVGDAAGTILFNKEDSLGTFTTENVYVENGGGTNDASVVLDVEYTLSSDTEIAGETGNAAISAYVGTTAGNPKGFTIGSTISEADKTLFYRATRGGLGDGFRADAGNPA